MAGCALVFGQSHGGKGRSDLNKKKEKYKKKIFTTLVIIWMCFLFVSFFITYYITDKATRDNFYEQNEKTLESIQLLAENSNTMIKNMSNSITINLNTKLIMYAKEDTRLYEIQRYMDKLQNSLLGFNYLHSFSIYNPTTEQLYNSYISTLTKDVVGLALLREKVPIGNPVFRDIYDNYGNKQRVISYFYYSNYFEPLDGECVIVNVDPKMFFLNSGMLHSLYILSADNKELLYPGPDSSVPFPVDTARLADSAAGYYIASSADHEKLIILYSKSSDLNWTFFETVPYSEITKNVLRTNIQIIIIFFISGIISFVLSIYLSDKLYQPVKQLLIQLPFREKEYESVKDEFEYLKKIYNPANTVKLQYILSSPPDVSDLRGEPNASDFWQQNLTHFDFQSGFQIALIKCLNIKQDNSYENDCQYVQSNIRTLFPDCCIDISGQLTLLFLTGSGDNEGILAGLIEDLKAQQYFITAAVTSLLPSPDLISAGIGQLRNIIKYSFVEDCSLLKTKEYLATPKVTDFTEFIALCNKLSKALAKSEIEQANNIFHKIIAITAKMEFSSIQISVSYITQIFSGWIQSDIENANYINIEKFSSSLSHFVNDSTIFNFYAYFSNCLRQLDGQEASVLNSSPRQVGLVNQLCEFIQLNYSNPDLNVSMIADHFKLSTGHISRLFKTGMQVTISTYIVNYRLEKAAQLIKYDSSINIETVSSAVGIENTNYFFRLFKKTYGVTPRQFYKLNEKADTGL